MEFSFRKILFIFIISFLVTLNFSYGASSYSSNGEIFLENLPGLDKISNEGFKEDGGQQALKDYVDWIITTSVAVGSMLAVAFIIFGGFKYLTALTPGNKSGGKEYISNAIMGLIFLIGGYIIFTQFNSKILDINLYADKLKIEVKATQNRVVADLNVPEEDGQEDDAYNNTVTYGASTLSEVKIERQAIIPQGVANNTGNNPGPNSCDPPNYLFCKNTNSMADTRIHPTLRGMFKVFVKRVESQLGLKFGQDYKVSQSGRSKAQHLENKKSGASQASVSHHCWGGAFDIHYVKGGTIEQLKKMGPIWYEIAKQSGIRGSMGAVWGGVWKSIYDPYHFQLPGKSTDWWKTDGTPK